MQTRRTNEAKFVGDLCNLFGIARENALEIMKIQEDRDVLIAQRENGRHGCLGQIDKVLICRDAEN